jgi:hypothetical protein
MIFLIKHFHVPLEGNVGSSAPKCSNVNSEEFMVEDVMVHLLVSE